MKLTDHFTFEELTKTNRSLEILDKNRAEAILIKDQIYILALFAEQVRSFLDEPMYITSGYRCKLLNEIVGGSPTSQHLQARAIDFVPARMTVEQAYDYLRKSPLIYGQLIIESSNGSKWVHVSMGYKRENLKYKDGKYTKQGA